MIPINPIDFSKVYRNHKFQRFVITNAGFDMQNADAIDIFKKEMEKFITKTIGRELVDFYNTEMNAARDMFNKKLKELFKAKLPYASIIVGRDSVFDSPLDTGFNTTLEGSSSALTFTLMSLMRLKTNENGLMYYDQRSDDNFSVKVGFTSCSLNIQTIAMLESKEMASHLSKVWEFKYRTGMAYDLIRGYESNDNNEILELPYELTCVIPNVVILNLCEVMEIDKNNIDEILRCMNHLSSSTVFFEQDLGTGKPVYKFKYPTSIRLQFTDNEWNDFKQDGITITSVAVRRNCNIKFAVPTFFRITTPIHTLDLDNPANFTDGSKVVQTVSPSMMDIKPVIEDHFERVDKVNFIYERSDLIRPGLGRINLLDIIEEAGLSEYYNHRRSLIVKPDGGVDNGEMESNDEIRTEGDATRDVREGASEVEGEEGRYRRELADIVKFDYVTVDDRDCQNDTSTFDIDFDTMELVDRRVKVGLKCHIFVYIDTMLYKQYLATKGYIQTESDVAIKRIL